MGAKARSSTRMPATVSVAFLRGMNLGKRRITNEELCRVFRSIGALQADAFLASGNVVCRWKASPPSEEELAHSLESKLGYTVPTLLRSMPELVVIAKATPFSEDVLAQMAGKLQVAFLKHPVTRELKSLVHSLSSKDDRLALSKREIFWLPKGGLSDSELNLKAIEKAAGPITIRIHRTVLRLTQKFQ